MAKLRNIRAKLPKVKLPDLRQYLDPRKYKRQNILAFVALLYASFLIAVLSFHFSVYFRGHYGTVVYEPWTFFYYFTFQTNIAIAIWMFCYAMVTFSGSNTRFARFIKHPLLIGSFVLNVTILFAYSMGYLLPSLIENGFTATRNGFAIFAYLLTPITMWVLYLFEKNGPYAKYKHPKHYNKIKILGSAHSRRVIQSKNRMSRPLRYRDMVWFLVYPTLYFGLNTIVGHTVIRALYRVYEYGEWRIVYGRAFAYPQLDPHFWDNIFIYLAFIFGVALFYMFLSFIIIGTKKYQYRHTRKHAFCQKVKEQKSQKQKKRNKNST